MCIFVRRLLNQNYQSSPFKGRIGSGSATLAKTVNCNVNFPPFFGPHLGKRFLSTSPFELFADYFCQLAALPCWQIPPPPPPPLQQPA